MPQHVDGLQSTMSDNLPHTIGICVTLAVAFIFKKLTAVTKDVILMGYR